jgi:phytoene dehydrogenase-like protein
VPLHRAATASFGLVLMAAGHAVGWPVARGGSGAITRAMASLLRSLGGTIETGRTGPLAGGAAAARAVLLNLTPRQLLEVAGDRLPGLYRARLRRYRYGPAAFKVDYALSGPIPWRAAGCPGRRRFTWAGRWTGSRARSASRGAARCRATPTCWSRSRACSTRRARRQGATPPGPTATSRSGSTSTPTERIERQMERYAPGFRDLCWRDRRMGPAELERRNRNLVGGDINGGTALLGQLFLRPVARRTPYALPIPGHYLCSSSTPPGGGVHGMCGYHAAYAALRDHA